jgi:hypothetical protein
MIHPAQLNCINPNSACAFVNAFNDIAKIFVPDEIEGIFPLPLRAKNSFVF